MLLKKQQVARQEEINYATYMEDVYKY